MAVAPSSAETESNQTGTCNISAAMMAGNQQGDGQSSLCACSSDASHNHSIPFVIASSSERQLSQRNQDPRRVSVPPSSLLRPIVREPTMLPCFFSSFVFVLSCFWFCFFSLLAVLL